MYVSLQAHSRQYPEVFCVWFGGRLVLTLPTILAPTKIDQKFPLKTRSGQVTGVSPGLPKDDVSANKNLDRN